MHARDARAAADEPNEPAPDELRLRGACAAPGETDEPAPDELAPDVARPRDVHDTPDEASRARDEARCVTACAA